MIKGVNLNLNLKTAVHRTLTDTKNIKKVNRYTLYSSLNEYIQCLVISTVLNGKPPSCWSEATYKEYIKDTPIPHVVVSPGQYLDFSASTTMWLGAVSLYRIHASRGSAFLLSSAMTEYASRRKGCRL